MIIYPSGSTGVSLDVRIVDDLGLPVTGLVAATFPAVKYSVAGANADVTVSLSDLVLVTSPYSSGGVKERGEGVYRFDLPNAALAATGLVTVRGETSNKRLIADLIQVNPVVNANVVSYANGQAPLQPTVAGRTLDVTTTGEAGIDWGNIGNKNAAVDLTSTAIFQVSQLISVLDQLGSAWGFYGPADEAAFRLDGYATVADIPTASQNAAAWGSRVLGNGRTADYYLMGGFNKTVRTASAFTVYSHDDTTALATAVLTEDGDLDPISSVDP